MTSDCDLLRQYADQGNEAAFAEVVHRHVNLVYASAVRLLNGDTALAEDVTQKVFTDLARKASALVEHASLAGWLHSSVRLTAAQAVRTEQRRRTYEQEASAMSNPTTDYLTWMQLRPLIDEAIGRLQPPEREAVLLRFFEEKSHREVGEVLGLTENAARMRVERALEKLRVHFARHGVTATVALLAATLGAQAASNPAPAAFAATLASQSLAGAASSTMAGNFGGGKAAGGWAQKSFATKFSAVLAGATVLVLSGILVVQSEKSQNSPDRKFTEPVSALATIKTDNTSSSNMNAFSILNASAVVATLLAATPASASALAATNQGTTQLASPVAQQTMTQDNNNALTSEPGVADENNPSTPIASDNSGASAFSPEATLAAQSNAKDTWIERISNTNQRLNGALWDGKKFIVVGEAMTVLTSPDGIQWSLPQLIIPHLTPPSSPTSNDNQGTHTIDFAQSSSGTIQPTTSFYSIAWNGKIYVIAGTGGVILTSPDAKVWTQSLSDTKQSIVSVVWCPLSPPAAVRPTNSSFGQIISPPTQPAVSSIGKFVAQDWMVLF